MDGQQSDGWFKSVGKLYNPYRPPSDHFGIGGQPGIKDWMLHAPACWPFILRVTRSSIPWAQVGQSLFWNDASVGLYFVSDIDRVEFVREPLLIFRDNTVQPAGGAAISVPCDIRLPTLNEAIVALGVRDESDGRIPIGTTWNIEMQFL